MRNVLIVTDAWLPQTDGVVTGPRDILTTPPATPSTTTSAQAA